MQYQLSVICPSIRAHNLEKVYDSIGNSFSKSWELIVISPYDLPEGLKNKENIQFKRSWASPISCQQQGLEMVKGVFVSWCADDGVFLPGALDIAFNKFFESFRNDPNLTEQIIAKQMDLGTATGIAFDCRKLIMGKYYEGNNDGDMPMQLTEYYILSKHDASKSRYIPINYLMLNVGLVPTILLRETGGWDCSFEVCPMAYNDLAIRLQNYGVQFIVQDEMMFKCSHLPGHAGDHGPIHDAQIYHDQPLFMCIYQKAQSSSRIFIEIDNWKQSPDRWLRRFGNGN